MSYFPPNPHPPCSRPYESPLKVAAFDHPFASICIKQLEIFWTYFHEISYCRTWTTICQPLQSHYVTDHFTWRRTCAFAHVWSEIRKMLLSGQKLFGTKFVAVIERRLYFRYTSGVRSPVFVFEITGNKKVTAYSSELVDCTQQSSLVFWEYWRFPTFIVVAMWTKHLLSCICKSACS